MLFSVSLPVTTAVLPKMRTVIGLISMLSSELPGVFISARALALSVRLPSQPSATQLSARMSPSFSAFLAFDASTQSFSICFSSSLAALAEAAGFFVSAALV